MTHYHKAMWTNCSKFPVNELFQVSFAQKLAIHYVLDRFWWVDHHQQTEAFVLDGVAGPSYAWQAHEVNVLGRAARRVNWNDKRLEDIRVAFE